MPAYELRLRRAAERDLERLAPMLFDRIAARIRALALDPGPSGTQRLSGSRAYRVRVGDHRIVYEVDDAARSVTVTRIRHRREVYRKHR